MKNIKLSILFVLGLSQGIQAQNDKYLWLEEVDGKKALEFVEKQNKATLAELSAEKDYQDIFNSNFPVE